MIGKSTDVPETIGRTPSAVGRLKVVARNIESRSFGNYCISALKAPIYFFAVLSSWLLVQILPFRR